MTTRENQTVTKLARLCAAIEQLPLQLRTEVYSDLELNNSYASAKLQLQTYKSEIRGQINEAVAESDINHRFNNIKIHSTD